MAHSGKQFHSIIYEMDGQFNVLFPGIGNFAEEEDGRRKAERKRGKAGFRLDFQEAFQGIEIETMDVFAFETIYLF